MKIVLIGASNNPKKYGNKILKDLKSKGYKVFPVNPKQDIIEGLKTYKTIGVINEEYDVVNFVVKPEVTLKILENNIEKVKNKKIWCQPGSSDNKIKTFLEEEKFKKYGVNHDLVTTK